MKLLLNANRVISALIFSLNGGAVSAFLLIGSVIPVPYLLIARLNVFFKGYSHGAVGGVMVYSGWSLLLAGPIFLLYSRLAAHKAIAANILLGVTSVGSAPLCWIFSRIQNEELWSRWLLAEIFLVTVWAMLFETRKSSFSPLLGAIVLIFHFALWAWKYTSLDYSLVVFLELYTSIAAALAWIYSHSKLHTRTLARISPSDGTFSVS